jgi:hypothetical protein
MGYLQAGKKGNETYSFYSICVGERRYKNINKREYN